VSWYEANAYCRWLVRHWAGQPESGANPSLKPAAIRLPTEAEWAAAAGNSPLPPGEGPGVREDRFPWDEAGTISRDETALLRRANTTKSGINRTTPVWAYPLGKSPAGVLDLGGNVWEWQANFRQGDSGSLALRGGSWGSDMDYARLSARRNGYPRNSNLNVGFRVVVLPG